MKCPGFPSLTTFLRCLGLEPLFKLDPDPLVRVHEPYWRLKNFINYLYPFLVFCVITVHPVAFTVNALKNKNNSFLADSFFLFLHSAQYYVGYRYFSGQHKKRIYESTTFAQVNPDVTTGRFMCFPTQKTLVKLIILLSSVLILESMIVYIVDQERHYTVFNTIGIGNLSYFIVPFSILYGETILILNVHVFFYSFFQQLQKFNTIQEKLQKRKWMRGDHASIANICYDIIDVRYTMGRLIRKMEYMFISTTFLGGLAMGVIIHFRQVRIQSIVNAIIFVSLELVFLYVIWSIGQAKYKLLNIIHDRKFAARFIWRHIAHKRRKKTREEKIEEKLREEFVEHYDSENTSPNSSVIKFSARNINELVNKNRKLEEEVVEILEWGTGGETSEEKKTPVKRTMTKRKRKKKNNTLSIHIPDSTHHLEAPPQPSQTSSSHNSQNTGTQVSKSAESDISEESENLPQYAHDLIERMELLTPIYDWVRGSGSSLDWIILKDLLRDRWEAFSVFGIEFDTHNVLQKAAALTAAIITVGNFFGDLEWLTG